MTNDSKNIEHEVIASLIHEGSSVLDLGCGTGDLLVALEKGKKCKVQGIEIDEQAIYKCVAKGLSVMQGDIDSGLNDYPDKSFDYVVLNQSFQQVKKPDVVLKESLRIGKEVIVGFPNFAHWSARCQMFFRGRTPVTPSLPFEWYNTPNLHFLSITDFIVYCRKNKIDIEESLFTGRYGRVHILPDLFAGVGIFLLTDRNNANQILESGRNV